MADLTVAIPTYNGAQRLPKVLDALRSQLNIQILTWEILVIDNNSTDHTWDVVKSYQNAWRSNVPLLYYHEPRQGLAFARQCAINHAGSSLIGFLDDDVVPASDWVFQAFTFSQTHPQAGAYGGQIHGNFESQPPKNVARIQSLLAIREGGSTPYRYRAESLSLPPGAALVVRKTAWQTSVPAHPKLIGRVNGTMISGEDYEVLLYMHYSGWELWYAPEMHSYHQIPQHRLEKDYLISLARGCGLCICHLRLIHAHTLQKPLIMAKVILGSLKRLLKHVFEHRENILNDPILACEFELWRSSMCSPFFFLKRRLVG